MLRSALLAACIALSACSARPWFEGMKEGARQQCRQTPDATSAQDCVDHVNRQRYEQYERERPRSDTAAPGPFQRAQ